MFNLSPAPVNAQARFHQRGPASIALVLVVSLVVASCGLGRSGSRSDSSHPVPTSSTESPTDSESSPDSQNLVADGLDPGDHTIALTHDGANRRYIVHVPPNVARPAPLMLAIHGGGGTGAQFKEENGMDEVSDRHGFVVVYPEGSGFFDDRLHTWNSGLHCCGWALKRDIDDVGFLVQVVEDVSTRITINPGRVYATGHSNGASMSYRLAAEAADTFVAVVPVAGSQSVANFEPTQPVAMLDIHSVDDPRALYEGGEGPPFPGLREGIVHAPVLDGLHAWSDVNGCDGVDAFEQSVIAESEDQRVDRLIWQGCETPVEHVRLTGVGHGWPGVSVGRVWQNLLGPPTELVNASEVAWNFASQFERG